jgi:hypothetical protein
MDRNYVRSYRLLQLAVQQHRKEDAHTTDPADPAIPKRSSSHTTSPPTPPKKETEKISKYTDKNNELHD